MMHGEIEDPSHFSDIPHVYTLLFILILVAALATWLVPAGEYVRYAGPNGAMVVPNTYHPVEMHQFGLMQTLTTVYRGMISAADTVFFIFITFASISVVVSTGAFHALIARLIMRFRGHTAVLVIPLFIFLIGAASSTIAVFEEMFPFVPIFVSIAISMKFDAIVGMAIVALGIGIGYSGSVLNPFTIGIAQNLAGLPPYSGALYRFFCHIVMVVVASGYVMLYALRVARYPKASLLYGHSKMGANLDSSVIASKHVTLSHICVLFVVLASVGTIVWGVRVRGWYFEQIASIYLLMAITSGFVSGWSPDKIARKWAESASQITSVCLKIALVKGIILILNEARIMDTVIYTIAHPLTSVPAWIGAEAMLLIQTVINFFIPSGAAQAVVSMPLMIPLSDLVGVSRQTAILAFQFGDGVSNILWLTGSMPIICRFARVPPRKWLRFFMPLFLILYIVQMTCIWAAVVIGY